MGGVHHSDVFFAPLRFRSKGRGKKQKEMPSILSREQGHNRGVSGRVGGGGEVP